MLIQELLALKESKKELSIDFEDVKPNIDFLKDKFSKVRFEMEGTRHGDVVLATAYGTQDDLMDLLMNGLGYTAADAADEYPSLFDDKV